MKLTAAGGTDGSNVVLFWPDNLPNDADQFLQEDPVALLEQLRGEGKLVRFPCDGDGAYTLAVFVREPVPKELAAVCRDEEKCPRLEVKGTGYFGGAEYAFKHDPTLREKYPHMCEPVEIPAGTYAATVYRTDVPEEVFDQWLAVRVGAAAVQLWTIHSWLAALAGVAAVAAVVLLGVAPWRYAALAAGAAAVLLAAAVALSRTRSYEAVKAAEQEFEEAFPAYVVHLE